MLKTIFKRVIGRNHWSFLSWYKDRFGLLPAVVAYTKLLRGGGFACAPSPLAKRCVFLRPGTADQNVYDQVFISKEYDVDLGDPRFIVDAGAHIGLASVFFACKYPNSAVVAIEPEASNFRVLLKNSHGYGNIKPVWAGLWSRRTYLRI